MITNDWSILKNYAGTLKGVLHSFSGSRKDALWAIDNGFYLGFNGILTFHHSGMTMSIT